MKHLTFATISLAAVLSAALAGCGSKHPAAEPAKGPPPDETWLTVEQHSHANLVIEPVTQHEVGAMIVAAGRMTFADDKVSHVFSPVSGRVTDIKAKLGDRVKKGDLLAVIQSPDISLASSDRAKAEADLIGAEHDYTRKKELLEAHAGSKSDFEVAEDNWRKAKAELARAKSKGSLFGTGANVAGGYGLRSLIEGEVITKAVNPGMEVQGQYGTGGALELFTIGEMDTLWMLAEVFEMDLPRVKAGTKVTVKAVSYPDKVFEGKVDWVSGTFDPGTRTARVRCTFPNPERLLKPEMYVTASILVEGRKALAIRRTAVQHMGETTVVYVEAGAAPNGGIKFQRRVVTVDEDEDGDYIPVTRGLQAGDKVVAANGILLQGS
jgi:cobalt-zinc-cadmium efflux system membrane fusion protein